MPWQNTLMDSEEEVLKLGLLGLDRTPQGWVRTGKTVD